MFDALSSEFMRNALIAAALASVAFGVAGAYVSAKKIAFVGGGVAHAAFGGVGLAYWLGFEPLYGATAFALAASVAAARLRDGGAKDDPIIGAMWAAGMAAGVLFVDLKEGYAPNLTGYLFGNILTTSDAELLFIATVDAVILTTALVFRRELQAVAFDEEFARSSGMPVGALNIVLYGIVGLAVVALARVTGIVLVVAMLTIPAAVALKFARGLGAAMIWSGAIGFAFSVAGLAIAYYLDLSPGAAIVFVALVVFLVVSFVGKRR